MSEVPLRSAVSSDSFAPLGGSPARHSVHDALLWLQTKQHGRPVSRLLTFRYGHFIATVIVLIFFPLLSWVPATLPKRLLRRLRLDDMDKAFSAFGIPVSGVVLLLFFVSSISWALPAVYFAHLEWKTANASLVEGFISSVAFILLSVIMGTVNGLYEEPEDQFEHLSAFFIRQEGLEADRAGETAVPISASELRDTVMAFATERLRTERLRRWLNFPFYLVVGGCVGIVPVVWRIVNGYKWAGILQAYSHLSHKMEDLDKVEIWEGVVVIGGLVNWTITIALLLSILYMAFLRLETMGRAMRALLVIISPTEATVAGERDGVSTTSTRTIIHNIFNRHALPPIPRLHMRYCEDQCVWYHVREYFTTLQASGIGEINIIAGFMVIFLIVSFVSVFVAGINNSTGLPGHKTWFYSIALISAILTYYTMWVLWTGLLVCRYQRAQLHMLLRQQTLVAFEATSEGVGDTSRCELERAFQMLGVILSNLSETDHPLYVLMIPLSDVQVKSIATLALASIIRYAYEVIRPYL